MASSLTAARRAIQDRITADLPNLRVDLDPRALNPPCVLVGVPDNLAVLTACALTATVPVYLLAPPPGAASALDYLTDNVWPLIDALGARGATAIEFTVGDGQAPMPAYRIECSTSITDATDP